MKSQNPGTFHSTFEVLENRVLLSGAPSSSQSAILYDAKGSLDVAYYDSSTHSLKFSQQSQSGVWSVPTTIDVSSNDVGQFVTMALNKQGLPAVAYQDSANADLKFAQFDGTSWTVTTVDKRKTTGFNPSLAFDNQGNALITYYKQNTQDLILARSNGKKWTLTTVSSKGDAGQFSSVAVDPTTGKASIAFTNGNGTIQYTSASGTANKTFAKPSVVAKVQSATGDVSLVISNGSPSIGYVDTGTGTINLAQPTGKSFTSTTIATVSPSTNPTAQVLIDPTSHMPAVVYHNTDGTYVAQTTAGSTTFQTTQVQSGSGSAIAVIAPDGTGLAFTSVTTTGGTLNINTTVTPPTAPTGVVATSNSDTAATISWTDSSTNVANFLIERSVDGTHFTVAASVNANVTQFADTGLTEGTTYFYRVSAVGNPASSVGTSTNSPGPAVVPATSLATVTTLPAAPSSVIGTAVSSSSVTVSWTANSQHAQSYTVQRSSDGGVTWTTTGTVSGNTASYTDTGLEEASSYRYLVTAVNAAGTNAGPATSPAFTLPSTPTNLVASATSATSISLTWQNASARATGFIIQRSTDGVHFTTLTTVAANVTVYVDSGLSEAFAYYYEIQATGPGGQISATSSSTNSVTDPSARSNLAATAFSTTRIGLTWADNSAGATNYIVQRSANGGAFVDIATLPAGSISYSDTSRVEGVIYGYRVQAITSQSVSAFSAVVTAITLPASPTSLTAANGVGGITLTWSDNSVSETGFQIERSGDNGQTWTSLAVAPSNSTSVATYTDATAGQGATYSYRVSAVNTGGVSATSNTASGTMIPAAPTGLTATAASPSQINLSWTNNSTGQTGITIQRSSDGGTTWTTLTTTAANASTYSDTGLSAGTTYAYQINAINSGGVSAVVGATALTKPARVTNLTSASPSGGQVDLSWAPVVSATSYEIDRSADGTTWTLLQTTPLTAYSDLNLTEATAYFYQVKAINPSGISVASLPTSATTRPSAPSSASATGAGSGSVIVTWLNNSNGATGFIVQRSSDNGVTWSHIATTPGNQSTYTDNTVSEATSYLYMIQAVDAGGSSLPASTPTVMTVPAAPTVLVATVSSATSVSLTWVNNSQNATGLIVQRSTDGANFNTLQNLDANAVSYVDSAATAATQYWYRVYATDAAGTSDYSNVQSTTTTPAATQNVSANATSASSITLTWNASSGALGYNVSRSTDGTAFTPLASTFDPTYTDTSAIEGTQYWYTVTATNSTGSSVSSQSATATTFPAAPSNGVEVSNTDTQAVLSWTNNSHSVTHFKIERSSDNGTTFSQIDTAAADATTYTDTTTSEGTHYVYEVIATGAAGDSVASNSIGVDTNPSAPTNFTQTVNSATSITLNWTNVSTKATHYVVARSPGFGAPFIAIQTLNASVSSFSDSVDEGSSYFYEVRATQSIGDGPTTLHSPWVMSDVVATPPAAPSNVQAISLSPTDTVLSWDNNSFSSQTFNIYRGTSSDNLMFLTTVMNQNQYEDQDVEPGTNYIYQVRAFGPGGDSVPANSAPLTTLPAAPDDVTASTVNNPSVTLSWSDVTGENGFTIFRSSDGGDQYQQVGSVIAGTTTFTDSTTTENVTYDYKVAAVNDSGYSTSLSPTVVTTYLASASELAATATPAQVSLSWTDNSVNATGYEVQRSDDAGQTWQSVTTSLSPIDNTYVDATVADGTVYSYQVRALGTMGNSDFTQPVNVTTPVAVPSNLQTNTASDTEIDLTWTNNSSTATGYQIFRSLDNGQSFHQIDVVAGSTNYSDTSLSAGVQAQYAVTATNSTGTSDRSNVSSAVTLPSAPTDLAVSTVSTTALQLNWTDHSTGADGYVVSRSDDGGTSFNTIFTAGPTATSYTDTGLNEGSSHLYKVSASNSGGTTAFTNISGNSTYCAAPTNLTVSSQTDTSVSLNWTNNTSGAIGYVVEVSTDNGASYQTVADNLSGSATQYIASGLSEATSYLFAVYAFNDAGPSDSSGSVGATTLPAAPTLAASIVAPDGISLSWQNNSASATGFIVERSSDNGATYPTTWSLPANQLTFTDSTVSTNTDYVYQVVTTSVHGSSAPSTAQSGLAFPGANSNFTGTENFPGHIQLAWTPDSNGASSYTLSLSTDGSDWSYLATVGGSGPFHMGLNISSGHAYQFQITADNSSGSSSAATTSVITAHTAAPADLAVAAVTAGNVSLSWGDIFGETGFVVKRSTDNVNWSTIGQPAHGTLTYTDTNAVADTTYYYQVAGSNAAGTGAFSSVSQGTLPASPTSLATTSVTASTVALTWSGTSSTATGYNIYRATAGGASNLLTTVSPGTHTYTDSPVAAGTSYSYQVTAVNSVGETAPTTTSALTLPAQVQGLNLVAASDSEIDLTWNQVTGAANYAIMRSLDNVNWTSVTQVAGNVLNYNDTGLTDAATYYYSITASNSTGSGQVATSSIATLPANVTSLAATSSLPTSVDLTWTDQSTGTTGYNIYRSNDNGQTFTLLTTINSATAHSYTDTVVEGNGYTYRVAPFDSSGEGISADVSITTVPSAAVLNTASPVSANEVDLAWTNTSAHSTSITIDRTVNGQNAWSAIAQNVAKQTTSYVDSTVNGGVNYQYKIITQGAAGGSPDSNILSALTVPSAVGTVTLTPASTQEIDLSWNAVTGATSYNILRSTNGDSFSQVGTVASSASTYHDTDNGNHLTDATRYYYMVVAANATGNAAASSVFYTSTLASAPSGLSAQGASNREIDLTWTNHSTNAQMVNIERSLDNNSFTLLASVATTTSLYTDTSVSGGTTYYYRLSSLSEGGVSYMTDHASVSALTNPDSPTLNVVPMTDGTVSLSWTAPTGATTYTVQHSTDGNTWTNVVIATASLSTTDGSLTANTVYQYRVEATNANGNSAFSSIGSTTTVPAAPTNLVASASSPTEIDLTWGGDTSDNITYTLTRSINSGATYQALNTVSGATSYADTTCSPGVTYLYQVTASNTSGANATAAISSSVVPLPTAPGSLVPTVVSDSEVTLAWSSSTGATSYNVYRSTTGGAPWTTLTLSPLNSSAISYDDTTATGGTSYTYKVVAINSSGSGQTTTTALTYPSVPTGLSTTVQDNHTIAVQWNAATGATSYTLQRTGNAGVTWIAVVGISGTSVTDTVVGGGSYSYRLAANDATGASGYATSSTVTVIPDAPLNVFAAASSDTSVHVSWSLTNGATGYVLQRSLDNGSTWTNVAAPLSANTASYDDTGRVQLTSYKYQVFATNGAGSSVASSVAAVVTKPTTATNLQVTGVTTSTVSLSWTDHTSGAAGYDVSRSADNGSNWTVVGTTNAGTTTFGDSGLSAGTTYLYRVIADNGSVTSAPTSPLPVVTVPAAPTAITAAPQNATTVGLTWTAPSGAATYTILRSVNGGSFSQLATNIAQASFTDSSAMGGTSYTYEVSATNVSGTGTAGVSNPVLTVPAAQSNFAATGVSAGEIDLSWTDVTSAISYTIQRSTNGGSYTTITNPVVSGNTSTFIDTNVTAATSYTYTIIGTNTTGSSVATSATGLTDPAAVSNVNGTVISTSEIDLTWSADSGTVSGYRVMQSTNGGAFGEVGSDLASNATSLNVTGLSAGTPYVFRVLALNSAGASANVATSTLTTIPLAPTGLSATAVSSSEIDLSWTDAAGSSAYEVDRSPNGNNSWITLTTSLAANAAGYQDLDLAGGTSYSYRVETIDAGGTSAATSVVAALTFPVAPTAVTSVAQSADSVGLSWTGSQSATSYDILQSVNGGAYAPIATSITQTTYTDTSATGGNNYQYEVEAKNDSGTGPASTATTSILTVPDAQPTFTATPISAGEVDLSWTDVNGATSYTIERSNDGTDFTSITMPTVAPSVQTWHDQTATGGTNYTYEIFGTDASGNSTTTIVSTQTVPVAITGFGGSVMSASEIDLSWTAPTDNVTGLRVYVSTNGGAYSQSGSDLPASTTSLPQTGLSSATTYAYKILAFNGTGVSTYATAGTFTTLTSAPTGLTATPVSSTENDLSWTDAAGSTAYEVDRSPNGTTNWTVLTMSLAANATSYQDSGLSADTHYSYRVEAIDAGGLSAATSVVTALTFPAAATGVTATANSADSIGLSWTGTPSATSYDVLQSLNGGAFGQIASLVAETSYTDNTATGGNTYQYEVRAVNGSGTGPASSASDSVLTLPDAQSDFAATPVSATEIDLAWTDVTGATTYTIQRATGDGSYSTLPASPIAAVGAGMPDSFADTTVAAGTLYHYMIVGTDARGDSLSSTASALTVPGTVTGLNGTVISSSEIDLSWSASSGAVDGYRVLESTNGGAFTQVGSDLTSSTTSLPVTGLSAVTDYVFHVLAFDGTGAGAFGTTPTQTTLTLAPTGLTATAASDTSVNLSWTDAAGSTAYEVDRSPAGANTWSTLTSSLASNATSYQDNSTSGGTSYDYRVESLDGGGPSIASSIATALTYATSPANFTSTPVSASEVDLSWNASTGATSYTLLRSVGGGMFSTLATGVGGLTYADQAVSGGTQYQYKIEAVDQTGDGSPAQADSLLTVPAAQTDFASAVISAGEVDLTWTDVTGATTYTIQRSINGGSYITLTDPALTALGIGQSDSYADTGLSAANTYSYKIVGTDVTGNSASTSTSALTLPSAVSNLQGTVISDAEVDLSWTADTGTITGYRLYRSINGGAFNQIGGPLASDVTTFSDTGRAEGTPYAYKVIAYNTSGNGLPSVTGTLTTLLTSPGLSAGSIDSGDITLTWTDNSNGESGYTIEELTAPNTWVDIHDDVNLNVTGLQGSYMVSGLTEATNYSFRAIADSASNYDSAPTTVNVSTAPIDPSSVAVTTTSPTSVALTWTNNSTNADGYEVQRSADNGTNWTTLTSDLTGDATSYTDTTGVEATAYLYQVAAFKGASFSNFVASASVTTLPASPTGLTATAISPTEIDLSWSDVSTGATAYRVYVSTDGDSYSQLGSDLTSTAHSYADMTAAENAATYYRVVAVDMGGESPVVSGNSANATTPLAAPTGVTASTTTDTTQSDKTIIITWTNHSGVATNVKLERSADNGDTWSPLTTQGPGVTTFSDTTAAENVSYLYRVWAVDGGVSSTHVASGAITSLLSRPTGLTLSSPTATSVTLSWTNVSTAATDYRIERSTNGVDFTYIGDTASDSANTYTDAGRTEGTLYYYRVHATTDGNSSNLSDVQSITTIPLAPTSLAASPFSTTEIDLTWTDPSAVAASYSVQRSVNAGVSWSTIATGLADNATTYNDTLLTEAHDYEYRIFAVGDGGASVDSNVVTATTDPYAPTNLAATAPSATSVNLTWTNNSATATAYEVDRSTGGGWTVLTSALAGDATSYTDNTAIEGTAYTYRVRGSRNSSESTYASAASVTTPPAAPSSLAVVTATSTRVTLSWTDNSNGETGFSIQRSTDGGINFSQVGTVAANSTTYNDNTVGEGASYQYYVYAYNAGGNSTNSGSVTANIKPATPLSLTKTLVTPTGVSLSWTNNSTHQTGFYIYSGASLIATVNSGTTYTVTTTEDTTFSYKVQAYGPTGTSGFTTSVTGTTPLNAPSNLLATSASATSINVTWTDNSSAENGYSLQRSTDGGNTWPTTINLSANVTSYTNTGLTEASAYTYRVQATRSGANSAYSSISSATTFPSAPSSVSGSATSDTEVTVTWSNNSANATGFTIQRSTDGTNWTLAGTAISSATTFSDSGLSELTAYRYRVEAGGVGGNSAWGVAGSTVTTLPSSPSSLIATAPASDRVALTWTDNSQGATGYQIYRQANGGAFALLATVGASATSYTDLQVNEATTYGYEVRTVSNGIYSAYSNVASQTTVPAAPDTLNAVAASDTEIDLTWADHSANATHYLVEQSTDGGVTFVQIAQLAGNATSYSNTGLSEDTDYQYQVRAQNAGGYSDYSNTAEAITLLATPTNLAGTPSAGHTDLTWTNNSAQDTGYSVMRSDDGGNSWVNIADLNPGSSSFSDTGATGGLNSQTAYKYYVICSDSNDGVTSAQSNIITVTAT